MEELIRFIVHNFFVVIVIAGFVISLLSKARKGETGRSRMPDFGGAPAFPKGQRRQDSSGRPAQSRGPAADMPEPGPARTSSVHRSRETTDVPASGVEAPQLMRAESHTASPYGTDDSRPVHERPPAAFRGGAPVGSGMGPAVRHTGGPFRMPEGSELKRAIVLAEILGPPRAKRPFRKP